MFEDVAGQRFLTKILFLEKQSSSNEISFASIFYDRFKGSLMDVASSQRGASLLQTLVKVPAVREDVVKELKKGLKALETKAKTSKGHGHLLNAMKQDQ